MQKSLYSEGYTSFLRLLRTVRKEAGLTQEDLAQALGETQTFVSKCERGERRIDVVELRAFCNAMGVSVVEFTRRFDAAARRNRKP